LDLDSGLEFDPARAEEFFSALPPRPAVCLIEPRKERAEPFLIRTQDLRRRLQRLLAEPDPQSKRLNLRLFARGVRYRLTGSKFEQAFAYYQNARQLFPSRYTTMMRLRPPAVLKVSLRNPYPRCFVTRHITTDSDGVPTAGAYFGPFASRKAAQAFAESILDFFKVRRCQIKIRRDPSFPGCIYSEMKMCLAPCFAGCTKEEYDAETARLVRFLETSSNSLRDQYEQERDKASEELDFEGASSLHKKLEKLDYALRGQPELPRLIQNLDLLILQKATEEQTVAFYLARGGRLAEPFFLRFNEIASQPRSAEEILRDHVEQPAEGPTIQNLGESLCLIARWFYSKPREGEVFFSEKDWPYRRVLRACSRLLAAGEPKSL
jgi:excinuclease UvrABC nuclease subunit